MSGRIMVMMRTRQLASCRQLVKCVKYTTASIFEEPFHKSRVCVKTVMSTYTERTAPLTSSVELQQSHKLVLTVRPNEFERLPPKCSACGTILQTASEKEAGYVPEAKFFDSVKRRTLDKLACYNCFRLRYHNERRIAPLSIAEVEDQLRHIRKTPCIVLYVVDLFDIEGTLMDKLLSYVSKKKRVIIVGNKIDRFPHDHNTKGGRQMEQLKDALKKITYTNGLNECNFRDICLISAKTGFGLDTLVQKINKHREGHMDVYLLGCANVGKSSLYNLLGNMLNVHKESPLQAQAIVHHTPGSTTSLVRTDISMRRLQRLQKRLQTGPWEVEEEYDFDDELLSMLNISPETKPCPPPAGLLETSRELATPKVEVVDRNSHEQRPCFLYDTPGIIRQSQLTQYLTAEEIHMLAPDRWVVPRTLLLRPGQSVFVGGLARLDYLSISRSSDAEKDTPPKKAAESIFVTAMASPRVPFHITPTETADEKFTKLFVEDILKIPCGSEDRYTSYPSLKPLEYTIRGKNLNVNTCDLVLHGVGWLSVAAVWDTDVRLALHTPNAVGQSLREDSILPYSVRTKEGRGEFYRGTFDRRRYGHTRKRNPELIRVFHEHNEGVYAWQKRVRAKLREERRLTREDARLERLEAGVVLGKWKALKDKETELEKLKVVM